MAYAKAWLEEAGLHTLIRSHQLVRSGAEQLECGGGCSVWTVFSASNYPDHTGFNRGAVLQYAAADAAGSTYGSVSGGLRQPNVLSYRTEEPNTTTRTHSSSSSSSTDTDSLSALVYSHRYRLRRAFQEAAMTEQGPGQVRNSLLFLYDLLKTNVY